MRGRWAVSRVVVVGVGCNLGYCLQGGLAQDRVLPLLQTRSPSLSVHVNPVVNHKSVL